MEFAPDTNYLVIKGRFKATASSSYGLFLIFMDNVTKNTDKIETVASHFSTVYDTNINMPWSELQDMITKLRWKGEFATSLTHDVQATLEDLFQPGTGRGPDIWNAIKKAMVNKAANFFEEFLARPTGDKGVKVELAIETITKSDIENVKKMREERDMLNNLNIQNQAKPTQTEPKLEESAVVLDVSLVLSPISGVPIYELKEGTKIFIKITEQTSRGQYFNDLLGANEGGEILPVPATVKKVSKEGKIYTVLVEIGPGIYGKSIDEDTVKVKLYDSAQDKRKAQKTIEPAVSTIETTPETSQSLSKGGSFLFWVMGGIGLLILMILVYLGLGI
ncbi:hypothetical protein BREVNS_1714 [Brevinematales bacterium NS]|nr:hypothetical protein [Brevinematales bacterium]QJR22464.1 hypothetical protein BREVNS_1714 [Brevinematales bacterium NS]